MKGTPGWPPGGGRGGEERPPGLTRTGSTSRPSGRAERFILAMCCSVASAACVFPVETLNRADSGMNWARTTKDMGIASGADLGGAAVIVPHVPPSRLPQTGRMWHVRRLGVLPRSEEARNERGLAVLVAVPARVTVGLTPRFTPVWLEPLVNTVKF